MFDNVAFEVVIGLVFIYLLYSLLVTILGEIVSTTIGLRARLLRLAIERMLNDGFYYHLAKRRRKEALDKEAADRDVPLQYFLDEDIKVVRKLPWYFKWQRGTVLLQHPDFKRSFAGKFYDYPAIKYLGRIESETDGKLNYSKPSYISADYFADSLINFLADKGSGQTIMDKVGFSLQFNTYHIQPNTLRQFKNLYQSSQSIELYKAALMKWFNETMDRTSGWHKRKMRWISFVIGFVIAAAFNVDTIKIAKILANDKEARSQLINMGVALAKDSARYKEFVTEGGDTLRSQAVLDTGFVRLQEDISSAGLVLGLGWDFSSRFKTTTTEIPAGQPSFATLNVFTDSLRQLFNQASTADSSLKASNIALVMLSQRIESFYADTVIAINEAFINRAKGIVNPDARLQQDLLLIDSFLRLRQNLQAKIKIDLALYKSNRFLLATLLADVKKTVGGGYRSLDSISKKGNDVLIVHGKKPYSFWQRVGYILSHIFFYSLVGFIVTALALSMGAPFWFDLLNKLVSIRGVGVKPEEKKMTTLTDVEKAAFKKDGSLQTTENPFINKAPDAVEAALQLYGPQLRAVPGVKAVFSVMIKRRKQIQVNVDDDITKGEVERLFPEVKYGQIEIPFRIMVCGAPSSQAGGKGVIANASGQNGFGSLSCIVKRTATQSKHILSCWHVLKGDLDYSGTDNLTRIIDRANDSHLAERWAGGIRAQFDYGFARCTEQCSYQDNSFLKEKLTIAKLKHRVVSQVDIDNQIDVKFYNALTNKITRGFIYTDTAFVDINYLDKTRTVADVLILTNDNETTLSKEGNSGSLVVDENGVAIGMIIGGDLKYTYAVKLSHVFKLHLEMEMA